MTDPTTPNIGLAQPTRGTDIGAWDTPVNNNTGVLDTCIGGIMTLGLNNSNVVLSAAQFQNKTVVFNSTLTGSVVITFPTSFTKSYEVLNECTGSSAFTITLTTTAAGGAAICVPLNEYVDVINDGKNMGFKNLGRVGSYWDHAGSSVPAWVSGCTVPPYLNCDGSGFSGATYPALANYMGGTTLPDLRGRVRGYLNQGTGRMTSSNGGVDGNTLFASSGTDTRSVAQANLPNVNFPVTDPGHFHVFQYSVQSYTGPGINAVSNIFTNAGGTNVDTQSATTGISVASGGSGSALSVMQPTAIGGITMIRAG
jgi:hypothetical protein